MTDERRPLASLTRTTDDKTFRPSSIVSRPSNSIGVIRVGDLFVKWLPKLLVLTIAPFLMAAIWMDDQQSSKPYKAPVLSPPAGAVPVSGKELVTQASELKNPVASSEGSLAMGKALFDINCALCHGQTSVERGPVGKKLVPSPPGLAPDLVKGLSDSTIFKAITFGFGRMPVFQDKLTPEERWDLVNFLRTRK
jgi:mono/diheme cytochrome c family protein